MSTEKPVDNEVDERKKKMKKGFRKQIKKLVAVYGDEKALSIMKAFVAKETAGKTAAAGD